jgi:TetR/AcrR family tetracycline transcriptional repressor
MTLRRLAKLLDVQAPALYWHFKSKNVLVDFMAEAILQQEFSDLEPRTADQPWQEWLATTMNRLRQAMLRHTDGARVVAGAHLYPAETLGKLFELSLQSLHSAGLDLVKARHITVTATTYTFGYVIEEQGSPSPDELAAPDVQEFLKNFPLTMASIQSTQAAQSSDEADFNAGLQLIINGGSQ